MAYINTIKYYIISDSGKQYRGITASFEVAKKLLEEAAQKHASENWKICYFWD